MAEWIVRGGADPQPPQPPRGPDATLRELIDVLAVGQSEQVGPATLTLLSVERYQDGFLAQFRLLQEYTPPEDPSRRGFPELVCEASDERGGRYTMWPNGGSGGGGRGVLHWRLAYRYAPALDPTARELRLSIPTVRWRHLASAGQPSAPDEVFDGPWRFLVVLPALSG